MDSIARLRVALVVFTVASAACLLGAGAALAGTLDQQQTDVGGAAFGIFTGGSLAQTFTAGISGGVDQVDLRLDAPGGSPATPLSVQIRDASGGAPGGAVLAAQSVPGSGVSTSPAFISVNFNPAAPVVAGTQYSIVAFSPTGPGTPYGWVHSAAVDPYPRGAGFFTANSPPSGAWSPLVGPAYDFAFKTYVVPSPPPTPAVGPTGQRAAALAKCKHKHSKRKRRRCRRRARKLPI